jgi:hypothetical protein
MKKEMLDKCREYLSIHGRISVTFLQQKFKLTHLEAVKLFEIINTEKSPI